MSEEIIAFDSADVEKNKNTSILMAIIPILFILPLVSQDMKNSAYLKFFANQSLIVVICGACSGIAGKILGFIPFVGNLLGWVFALAVFVLYVLNIVNAVNGSGKKLPFVGGISIIN